VCCAQVPSLTAALEAGKPITVQGGPTLADGLLVPRVGTNAFALCQRHVDKTVLVSEKYIALAMLRLLEMEKAVVEGGGATGLAAMLQGLLPELEGKKVVIPLCGGNVDTPVLGRVLERGLAADGRLVRFTTAVSDRPGGIASLTKVRSIALRLLCGARGGDRAVAASSISCRLAFVRCEVWSFLQPHGCTLPPAVRVPSLPLLPPQILWENGASIKDIYHNRASPDTDIGSVRVTCVVETADMDHAQRTIAALEDLGYEARFVLLSGPCGCAAFHSPGGPFTCTDGGKRHAVTGADGSELSVSLPVHDFNNSWNIVFVHCSFNAADRDAAAEAAIPPRHRHHDWYGRQGGPRNEHLRRVNARLSAPPHGVAPISVRCLTYVDCNGCGLTVDCGTKHGHHW